MELLSYEAIGIRKNNGSVDRPVTKLSGGSNLKLVTTWNSSKLVELKAGTDLKVCVNFKGGTNFESWTDSKYLQTSNLVPTLKPVPTLKCKLTSKLVPLQTWYQPQSVYLKAGTNY